jgi:hypothetical protein
LLVPAREERTRHAQARLTVEIAAARSKAPTVKSWPVRRGIAATWPDVLNAESITRNAGAKWNPEHKAWLFPRKDRETEHAIDEINARLGDLAASSCLAAKIVIESSAVTVRVSDNRLAIATPADPGADALLSRLGAAWSKSVGCHMIELEDIHHVGTVKAGLANLDSYLDVTAEIRPITAALNAKHPRLNACVAIRPNELQVLAPRPNFDPKIAASLKGPPLSATWDSDAIAWVTAISIREAATVSASLTELQSQLNTIAPRGLAAGIVSTHPLIGISAKDRNVLVRLSKDHNADRILNSCGFTWSPGLKAYATVLSSPHDRPDRHPRPQPPRR